VAGDLRDVTICPGPYDVIVERKTLQLFAEDEKSAAISAVAQRLGPRGIFFPSMETLLTCGHAERIAPQAVWRAF
jgi:hypothetical protein